MPAKENPDTKTRCSRCGAMFVCNPGADCWCTELPELPMPAATDATCFCPACLRAVLERNWAKWLPVRPKIARQKKT